MKKMAQYLRILFAAQLVLAVILFFSGPDLAAVRPDTPLLDIGKAKVDRLVIEGEEETKVVLKRVGEAWSLPNHYNFPADKEKVEGMLARLRGVKTGMPVATTSGALKRFKISDDSYVRRIILSSENNDLATLFLGTSPGMRRIHARSKKDDAVFSVAFAAHDAPAKPEDWENKEILRIPEGEIERIQVENITLLRQDAEKRQKKTDGEDGKKVKGPDPTWIAEGLSDGESIQMADVEALVQKLANLRIGRVLGIEIDEKYGLKEPVLTLTLTRKGQGEIEYRIGKHVDDSFFVIKASTRSEYFRIPQYTGNNLVENAVQEKLVKGSEKKEPDEAREEKS